MKFSEAMRLVESGKKVRRNDWDRLAYVCLDEPDEYALDLATEWSLEETKYLTFMEVCAGLEIGRKYRRPGWIGYIYTAHQKKDQLRSTFACLPLTIEDYLAEDWIELKG